MPGSVVVAVDVAAEGADATITSDNTQAGEMACKYITDRLKGKGNVVIDSTARRYPPCKTASKDARLNLNAILTSKCSLTTSNVKGSREGGLEVMTGLLAANPKIERICD